MCGRVVLKGWKNGWMGAKMECGYEGRYGREEEDELTEEGMKGEQKRLGSLQIGGREDCMNNPGGG